jgi:Uncharacterised protein family (UPF0203)
MGDMEVSDDQDEDHGW